MKKKIGLLLVILVSMFISAGCITIPQGWWPPTNWIGTNNVPPVVISPPADQQVKEWDSYYAPLWMQHGTENENEYRQSANEAAVATGCLKYNYTVPSSPDLAIWLLHWAHPARSTPGNPWFKPDNWTDKGRNIGVSRNVLVVPALSDPEKAQLIDYYKDYSDNTIQFLRDGVVKPRTNL